MLRFHVAFGAALLFMAIGAQAATLKISERQVYYFVSGASERALLLDMRRRGPRIAGRPALAATRMQARYSATLRRRGARCRVQRMHFDIRFTMQLPRLSRSVRLSSAARKRWRQFQRMLVRHEKRHIAIWSRCIRQVRRELPRLSASDCVRLRARLKQRYRAIMDRCSGAHEAFDRREKHAAPRVPFIRAALRH